MAAVGLNNVQNLNFGRPTSREKIEYLSRSDTQTTYSVDLSSINIKDAPDLSKYKHCKSIDLSCNQISSTWEETCLPCTHLKEIKLYSNHLSKIEGMKGLQYLENLQLQYNKIKEIGDSLKDCRNLKFLRLDSNLISSLQTKEIHQLRQLTYLDISNNTLVDISAFCCLGNLQELYCSHNKLSNIPDLTGMKKLKEIDFSYNLLTSLKGLRSMASLSILDVKNNNISSLSSMKCIKTLTDLSIGCNKLSKLVDIPKQFPNIEVLGVSENNIKEQGEVKALIGQCSELKELDLQGNPVSQNSDLHQDLKTLLLGVELQYINGKYMKKTHLKRPTSAMRPMTANGLVSRRTIANQLQQEELCLADFEERLRLQFAGIQGLLEELPKERPKSSNGLDSTKYVSVTERPKSRCSSRNRISEARAFAEKTFRTGKT